MDVLEIYQQSAFISSEEEQEIVELIEKNSQTYPIEIAPLYRGLCIGKKFEKGDIITVSEKSFSSWTEDINIAESFSKERGSEISVVFELSDGNINGLPLTDSVDHEMEWLLLSVYYEVVNTEDRKDYMLCTLIPVER